MRSGMDSARLKLTPSSEAAMARPQRKQVTSQAWLSISRRSYHLRKPSLPIERAGSIMKARSRFRARLSIARAAAAAPYSYSPQLAEQVRRAAGRRVVEEVARTL